MTKEITLPGEKLSEENLIKLKNVLANWFKNNEEKNYSFSLQNGAYDFNDLMQDTYIKTFLDFQKISEKNIFYIVADQSIPNELSGQLTTIYSLKRQGNSVSKVYPGMRLLFIVKSIHYTDKFCGIQYDTPSEHFSQDNLMLFDEKAYSNKTRKYDAIPIEMKKYDNFSASKKEINITPIIRIKSHTESGKVGHIYLDELDECIHQKLKDVKIDTFRKAYAKKRFPTLEIQIHPNELPYFKDKFYAKDIDRLEKSKGKEIKLKSRINDIFDCTCKIDKENNYLIIVRNNLISFDEGSTQPDNKATNNLGIVESIKRRIEQQIFNSLNDDSDLPEDSFSKHLKYYFMILENVTKNKKHLKIYNAVVKEIFTNNTQYDKKRNMEMYYEIVARKFSESPSNVKTVFNRINKIVITKLLVYHGRS